MKLLQLYIKTITILITIHDNVKGSACRKCLWVRMVFRDFQQSISLSKIDDNNINYNCINKKRLQLKRDIYTGWPINNILIRNLNISPSRQPNELKFLPVREAYLNFFFHARFIIWIIVNTN